MKKLGYVSVNLKPDTQKDLTKDIVNLGLAPITEFPYHVTVLYDENGPEEPLCMINGDVIYEATILGFKPLGKAIVAELHSIGLHKEFKRLQEAGYVHSYENNLLHMSLVYKPNDYELEIVKQGLSDWLGKTLQFSNETLRENQ